MYISNGLSDYKGLGRYTNASMGNYGGLGRMWGDASLWVPAEKDPASPKPLPADGVPPAKFNPVKDIASEFPPSVSLDVNTAILKDPEDFIPKPHKIVNAYDAMKLLKRPHGARGGKRHKTKGKVYWTPFGPKWSETPVKNAGSSEKVPPPTIKFRPNEKIVKDLPVVPDLEEIVVPELPKKVAAKAEPQQLQGFGDTKKGIMSVLVVLGLLFLLLRR